MKKPLFLILFFLLSKGDLIFSSPLLKIFYEKYDYYNKDYIMKIEQNINEKDFYFDLYLNNKKFLGKKGFYYSGTIINNNIVLLIFYQHDKFYEELYNIKNKEKLLNIEGSYWEFQTVKNNIILYNNKDRLIYNLKEKKLKKFLNDEYSSFYYKKKDELYYIKNKTVYYKSDKNEKQIAKGFDNIIGDKYIFFTKNKSKMTQVFWYNNKKINFFKDFDKKILIKTKNNFLIVVKKKEINIFNIKNGQQFVVRYSNIIKITRENIFYRYMENYYLFKFKDHKSEKICLKQKRGKIHLFTNLTKNFYIDLENGLCYAYLNQNLFILGRVIGYLNDDLKIPYMSTVILINNKSINTYNYYYLLFVNIYSITIQNPLGFKYKIDIDIPYLKLKKGMDYYFEIY